MTKEKIKPETQYGKTPVYDAFRKYGFKDEANTIRIDKQPLIGYYITVLDKCLNDAERKQQGRYKEAYDNAKAFVTNFLENIGNFVDENRKGNVRELKTTLQNLLN